MAQSAIQIVVGTAKQAMAKRLPHVGNSQLLPIPSRWCWVREMKGVVKSNALLKARGQIDYLKVIFLMVALTSLYG